ncbi:MULTISPECIES: Vms1/Ankzf1 family peptidyl-tRNA hydrolase [unclassified Haladaptatus]|uniref:Vms1/Ankzf1 family peptidyl-tRNA hydrolase n=1 Tax=unclassified Haladaptatus TaxID=2622732 RepID=UPI0023E879D5|nr:MULTISPECIES: Vms1/Ankzf1 family peptidyl-tRNA hydrolase [unclassified Haladaptatus]
MFDDLLGRTELKSRIEELEEEKRHLERQLEAEQDRRADAVSARQTAEERVNRLEDRIASLEGRLDQPDEERSLAVRREERLRGDRLEEVLSRLESVRTGPEGALSAVVTESVPEDVSDLLDDRAALVSQAVPCVFFGDDAGLVSVVLEPPLVPDERTTWDDHFAFDRAWFEPTGTFAFALVRSDLFALGEYDGRERVSLTGFETDVKSNHSKGGFSQGRFERIREGQIADHVQRCLDAVERIDADRLIVVGERTVLGKFKEHADATRTVDATGDPETALDDAFRDFFTTRLSTI